MYINDVPCQGPATCYINSTSTYEAHPDNLGIHQFVWEHFEGLNKVVQCMNYCGGTFSGYKVTSVVSAQAETTLNVTLCAEDITVVGHRCTIHG